MKRNTRLIIPVLIFIFIFTPAAVAGPGIEQSSDIRFQHITTHDGLSHNSVSVIHQDSKGFLWFGTMDGLNQYDGYRFNIFRYDPDDPNSIRNNDIRAICEDSAGILWIGTQGAGLHCLDPSTQKFTWFRHDPDNPQSLSHDHILSMVEDPSGKFWIGTWEGGLNLFDPVTQEFTCYRHDPEFSNSISSDDVWALQVDSYGKVWVGTGAGLDCFDSEMGEFIHYQNDPNNPDSISSSNVSSLMEDRQGNLWIGTKNGLDRYVSEQDNFVHYRHDPKNQNSLSDNEIVSLFQDSEGIIWVGTYGAGINRLDPENGHITQYLPAPGNPESLSGYNVWGICEDSSGILWVGTEGGGLNRINLKTKPFAHYRHDPSNPGSLNNNAVWAIQEDHQGDLWLGTSGGLNHFDQETGECTHYTYKKNDPFGLKNNVVLCLLEDSRGELWVGTYGGGLHRFNRKSQRFRNYKHNPQDPHSISYNSIISLYEDSRGELWIGTFGGGLNRFDPATQRFKRYLPEPDNPKGLSDGSIWAIYEDSEDNIWVGSNKNGLNLLDRESGHFSRFTNDPDDPGSISYNSVMSIYEDSQQRLWIGTGGLGLNLLDRRTNRFTHFTDKDGLPDNMVFGILEDEEGNLWLSTNKGLSKFNPEEKTFKNYSNNNGMPTDDFSFGSYFKSPDGRLYFGTNNDGFIAFYPDSIQDNPQIPKVVITDMKILNRSVPIGKDRNGRMLLSKNISSTDDIQLSYRDRILSFEFAALHFSAPDKNEFAYKLEGLETDWNYVGTRRFVTYTNLPPANYVFKVKASNNDGVWNEEGVSLAIKISPPFVQTWWFRGLAVLCLAVLIVLVFQIRTRNIRERACRLEDSVKERTSELQQEVMERKRLEQAANKRAAQASLIYEAGQRVSSQLDLDELLSTTVQAICDTFDYYGVFLFIKDEQGEYLELKSVVGSFADAFSKNFRLKLGEGMIGKAALMGKTLVSGDVARDPYYFRYKEEETQSELSVPIKSQHGVIGVLDVQSNLKYAFDEADVAAMETLSTQIVNALENARLYEQAQQEIQERCRAEKELKINKKQLEASLEEKVVLLKEIHHRVKNNLQIISSMLNLQSGFIKDRQALAMFQESKHRVRAMGLIHEKLYQAEDLARINYAEYIRSLTSYLFSTYRVAKEDISLVFDIWDISLDINKAIPCSLIINELLSNSLKYAFPNGVKGLLRIMMHHNNGHGFVLMLGDNGVGLPEDMDFRNTDSLGLQLVNTLVSQLNGTIELDRNGGATFTILFP